MEMNRRGFLELAAGSLAYGGLSSVGLAAAKRPEPDFYWSYLAHFGINSWKDIPLETQPADKPEKWLTRCCADHVRFDTDEWLLLSEHLRQVGCNQIIIDLAEIVEYPSHPELAVKGSWSPDKLRDELRRLRGMGFEVVPKMNFSACHDSWLKDYGRMVSTKKYYQVCADVIRDAIEIFDRPRLFHFGFDEELTKYQTHHLLAVCRQGDLWWHDLNFIADEIGKGGARPWMWSDYIWNHKDEYLKRMSKSILQSNWYYGANFDAAKLGERAPYIEAYRWLSDAGFDQVPTGSNFSCDTNFDGTIAYYEKYCRRDLLKGYMMAPWTRTFRIHHDKSSQAADQLGAAILRKRS